MNWLNPVHGNDYDRNEWLIMQPTAGESVVVARIRRERPGSNFAVVALRGEAMPSAVGSLGDAFARAAEFARAIRA
ncbi:hypothetical protein NB688_000596 [Xanthomonas sacchari]|uniref:Uncharacterized protein n=2 Tax=Xanthomonas sacchari TaxID=56458 RepID=A0ABT3DTQ4_9XANT|nr:hypothetical protein [Xanthomonas sacchari]MCW0418430.1 hypothetical protein [Xanthomonas sacchari]